MAATAEVCATATAALRQTVTLGAEMAKSLQERIAENKTAEARATFAGYVQSVAFNMTLSRNMVDMLGVVRDQQAAGYASYSAVLDERGTHRNWVGRHSVPLFNSLMRRGLVIFNHWDGGVKNPAPKDWRYHELTRAGELMCELLVEAGLLAALSAPAKRKAG